MGPVVNPSKDDEGHEPDAEFDESVEYGEDDNGERHEPTA